MEVMCINDDFRNEASQNPNFQFVKYLPEFASIYVVEREITVLGILGYEINLPNPLLPNGKKIIFKAERFAPLLPPLSSEIENEILKEELLKIV